MTDTTPQQYGGGNERRNYGSGYGSGGRSGGFQKRKRDEPMDEQLVLLNKLIHLGDKRTANQAGSIDHQVKDLARQLKRHTASKATQLQEDILQCCIQLGNKVHVYAALIGLLNVDDYNFVGGLLQLAASTYCEAWQDLDHSKARLVLRLLASLVVVHVVSAGSVFTLITDTVTAATDMATGPLATEDPSGRTWQRFTDAVVQAALLALPWGGIDLWPEMPPSAHAQLHGQVQAYLDARPLQESPALGPFFQPLDEEDVLAGLDNEGASFLTTLWAALHTCQESDQWSQLPIPRVHESLEQQLAVGEAHDIPPLQLPVGVPGMPTGTIDERAAWLLDRLPGRGVLHLLDPQLTRADRPPLAVIIAEQYMLDVLKYWEDDRVECAVRLARELPLDYNHAAQLCEVMFGQMLRTPLPVMRTMGYYTMMVDLCKLLDTFARSMSGCVKQLFARCATMYPELQRRWADWLAYHLTNFNFTWPWFRWAHVLQAPVYDPQRHFVTMLLSSLVRLAYRQRVAKELDDNFQCLLPPEPLPAPLQAPPTADEDPETALAVDIVKCVRDKMPAPDLHAWLNEHGVPRVGSPTGVLRGLVRALLTAGSKSFTHMVVVVERYHAVLVAAAQEAGDEAEDVMLDAALAVWSAAPQRATMAVDRLLAQRLVSTPRAVDWVFTRSKGVRCVADHLAVELSYELLYCIVDKTIARTVDAADDLAAAEEAAMAAGDVDMPDANASTDLEEKHAELQQRLETQKQVLLGAAQGFANLLAGDATALLLDLDTVQRVQPAPPPEGEEAPADEVWSTEELQAHAVETWHNMTLARAQGLFRRYHVAVAPIVQDVKDVFGSSNESVQQAVDLMLHC